MNNLQINEAKAQKMDAIEDLSLDAIKNALEGNVPADEETVKVAVKMMGVVAKNRQTLTHRGAVEFAMASSIATEQQLKKYIEVTNPQIKKALGGKAIA